MSKNYVYLEFTTKTTCCKGVSFKYVCPQPGENQINLLVRGYLHKVIGRMEMACSAVNFIQGKW